MLGGTAIRVCHLASGDLWAGAEVQIATLLRALKADETLDLSAIVLNEGRLAQELAAAGIPVTIFEESAGAVSVVRSLVSHLSRHRPDILHSHRYKEHILGAFASKLSHNPIVVQTYHGLEERLRGWAGLKMSAYTALNTTVGKVAAHGFIGVSAEIAHILQQRYPSGEVRCIRNGVDLDRVKPQKSRLEVRQQLGISPGAWIVGTVCRLTPIKGIEYLIRASAIVREHRKRQPVKLVIVGDGPLRSALEHLAREVDVADDTLFLGARTDVYDLMATFDVLALPSLHEGIPMVVLEAMAVGVPVIASAVGGIPEIVKDGQEAVLVPAQDGNALAHAIDVLSSDAALWDRLRKAARVRVESQFSIDNTASKTGDLYRTLIKEKIYA